MTSPSSPKGILEAVLYAKDLRAIEVFYRRALGLEPYGKPDERQLFFRCGDQMLLIFNPDVTERPPVQDGKLPSADARRPRRGTRLLPRQRR